MSARVSRARIPRAPAAALGALLLAACRVPGSAPVPAPSGGAATAGVEGQFTLPDDLEVTLWADSPLFYNPTNLDVDARGRVWVTEAVDYREFNRLEGYDYREGGDRVVILEDSDRDGRADRSTVFVHDSALVAPMGISVMGDRVVVSSSPSLLVYTDRDGGDRADVREVLLTGFGGKDHDHGLHVAVAGPDGDWYLSAGNAGPHTVADRAGWTLRSGSIENGGSPHAHGNTPGRVSDDGRIYTGGLLMRVRPDGTGLRVLAHNMRNSYETAVDSYGELWQNDNDDQIVTCRMTWLMPGADLGYFGGAGSRRWEADRRPGQDVFTAQWHQEDPGVHPAGDRTGAGAPTGVVVYEGDALGAAYRGLILSADAGRNVVFGFRATPQGAGFRLDRSDFLSSRGGVGEDYVWNDRTDDPRQWFRPSDLAVGTDGALYVADWYDPIVGGHLMHDQRARGRIYRIAPRGRKLTAPRIDLRSVEGQIEALLSPAVNVRHAGFVALRSRGSAVLPRVRALLQRENPYHRARAIWLLAQLGPAGVREVDRLLDDPAPETRVVALRALLRAGGEPLALARRLARDPSPAVRREVALALRDLRGPEVLEPLVELARGFDGADRWYLEALGTAAEGREEELYARLRATLGAHDPLAWDARFAGLAWRLHPRGAVEDLRARAASERLPEQARTQALVALGFVRDPAAAEAMAGLTHGPLRDVARQAAWWVAYRAGNDWHGYPLAGARPPDAPAPAAATAEQLRLFRALADSATAVERQVDSAIRLAEDPLGGALLVAALARGHLSQNVRNAAGGTLRRNPSREVRVFAEPFVGTAGSALSLDSVAARVGDAAPGEGVFRTVCAACHRLDDQGPDLGPDLRGVGTKFDRAGLVEAIVHPSRSIAHDYDASVLVTRDGSALFGRVLSEGPTVLFREVGGRRHTLERERIEEIRPLRTSPMPRPHLLGLDAQQVADVAAYLAERR